MSDSVLLWTRITPPSEATPGSGLGPSVEVLWEVATDAAFSRVAARGRTQTGPERDHTVKVTAGGLSAAKSYYFRFSSRGKTSPIGRTRTAPRHEADVARLRFGVVSCANWSSGYFGAYGYLASRDDLDAIIHLGDYLYEGTPGPGDLRPSVPDHELVTLSDYRQRHAMYKTDEHVQQMHARHPMIATWDDHEAADNAWSGGSYTHDPATEGTWLARQQASHQAYFEWMPVRHRGDKLYRRLKFGKLADLTMLDLRTYRTRQPEPGQEPEGTILGPEQRQWLLDGLTHGTASWNLIGNSVMVAPLKVPPLPQREARIIGAEVKTDQWDGYPADRRRVVETLSRLGRGNTVFLTGDIHTSWAIDVENVAVEFVCTSVSSSNLDDALGVPPRTGSLAVEAAFRAANPHVKFVELDSHGPSVLEVTPGAVQMDWYYLAEKNDPASTVSHGHSYRALAGDPRVHPSSP
jgi:alkaline phosphatase D